LPWLQPHHSWKGTLTPPLTPLSLQLQPTPANLQFDTPLDTGHWPWPQPHQSLRGRLTPPLTPLPLQRQRPPANLRFDTPMAARHWPLVTGRGSSLTTQGRAHSPVHSLLSHCNSSTRQPAPSSTDRWPLAPAAGRGAGLTTPGRAHSLLHSHLAHLELKHPPANLGFDNPAGHRPLATGRRSGLITPGGAHSPLHSPLCRELQLTPANLRPDTRLASGLRLLAVAPTSPLLEGSTHPSTHSSLTRTPAHAGQPPVRHPAGHWTLDTGRGSSLPTPGRAQSPLHSLLLTPTPAYASQPPV
jgi:hypothetical protein